eukprot:6761416-Heterocapsa_arctica.AAC.1
MAPSATASAGAFDPLVRGRGLGLARALALAFARRGRPRHRCRRRRRAPRAGRAWVPGAAPPAGALPTIIVFVPEATMAAGTGQARVGGKGIWRLRLSLAFTLAFALERGIANQVSGSIIQGVDALLLILLLLLQQGAD